MAVLKTLRYLMVLVVAGVVVGAIIIILGGCTTDSGMSRGERAIWFVESSHAGELAGYDDCENHRLNGATANVGDWDSDSYLDGYSLAYDVCSYSQIAYERGEKDGGRDCSDRFERYNLHYDSSGGGDWQNDYDRGYNDGYGHIDCYDPTYLNR